MIGIGVSMNDDQHLRTEHNVFRREEKRREQSLEDMKMSAYAAYLFIGVDREIRTVADLQPACTHQLLSLF
jgi:hypothetical protein